MESIDDAFNELIINEVVHSTADRVDEEFWNLKEKPAPYDEAGHRQMFDRAKYGPTIDGSGPGSVSENNAHVRYDPATQEKARIAAILDNSLVLHQIPSSYELFHQPPRTSNYDDGRLQIPEKKHSRKRAWILAG